MKIRENNVEIRNFRNNEVENAIDACRNVVSVDVVEYSNRPLVCLNTGYQGEMSERYQKA